MPSPSPRQIISALYVATFNRAPDNAGLRYWEAEFTTNSEAATKQLSFNFTQNPVFTSLYPTSLSNLAFVQAIYVNVLGSAGDEDGILYWNQQLNEGMSRSDFLANFVTAALSIDLDAKLEAKELTQAEYDAAVIRQNWLQNKVDVGLDYADTLGNDSNLDPSTDASDAASLQADPAYQASIAILAGVDNTNASVIEAITVINTAATTSDPVDYINHNAPQVGPLFTLTPEEAADAQSMRLTGNMDVRIDFTHTNNQITGLDLNGNGVIEKDGVENAITGKAAGFEVVDAYARNPLNQSDVRNNFLGDISYDGTGFQGDGVSTNGNIFLGGLGADTAFGGIGNDFLAGGAVAVNNGGVDSLSGGRNSDFFYTELSALDDTDGNHLLIDGGVTADDNSAGTSQSPQDTDWLLIEASDDDEPVNINLEDHLADENGDGNFDNDGSVVSRSGQTIGSLKDVENVDASGNLYGFIDDVNVLLGGRTTATAAGQSNYGIGSSAQLLINGSIANNTIIGSYDNDVINGDEGNDLLMGGNMQFFTETVANGVTNPNLAGITNDGIDELHGGLGDDNIVLELDTGIAAGNEGDDTLWITNYTVGREGDTEGASAAAILATDQKIRIDLGYNSYRGYRGDTLGENTDHSDEANATSGSDNVPGTADQTNYASQAATTVTGFENVIATGLGGIDYLAAGANKPNLVFENQQNFFGTGVDLELRGTDGSTVETIISSENGVEGDFTEAELDQLYASYVGAFEADGYNNYYGYYSPMNQSQFNALLEQGGITFDQAGENEYIMTVYSGNNTLYAYSGDDILEGRAGDDMLSGGEGNDDFVFQLIDGSNGYRGKENHGGSSIAPGDGVDVIHRQNDLGNNLTDGTFVRDFGLESTVTLGASQLTIDFDDTNLASPDVNLSDFSIRIGITENTANTGTVFAVTGAANLTALQNATSVTEVAALVNEIFHAQDANISAEVDSTGKKILIIDQSGRAMSDTITEGYGVRFDISNGFAQAAASFGPADANVAEDRIIYKAYEDRLDNEGVDDDSVTGSTISLGRDAYAEDLVVDFAADGTRLAEDQQYKISFDNLTTEDIVSMTVNGVVYELQVGVALNGTQVEDEDGVYDSQEGIQDAFLSRYSDYINAFMDDDTSAGKIASTVADTNGDGFNDALYITQVQYSDGEEVVFMKEPVVTLTNLSGGQIPVNVVTNVSQHEVHLLDYVAASLSGQLDRSDDGQAALNGDNVLFVGEEFINRSLLQTALDSGETITGNEAVVINGFVDDLVGIPNNLATDSELQTATPGANVNNGNFAVHGDDYLIGGAGNDIINGMTGDDRVRGSAGTDVVDGGKEWYSVRHINETKGTLTYLNAYEAEQLAQQTNVLQIYLIQQTENGDSMVPTGEFFGREYTFDDTLVFHQADFQPGESRFNITLDGFDGIGDDIEFKQGGAGTVATDMEGDGVNEYNTTFTNFEHLRTVSGVDRAVANVAGLGTADGGQGHDSLNLVKLSDASDGVDYVLTNDADAGLVSYTLDGHDTHVDVMTIDGVENLITGTGNDYLFIDETEAAKDNVFDAGTKANDEDVIVYENNYDGEAFEGDDEPTLTIIVENGVEQDLVRMTEGRVGRTVATDTLNDVEVIELNGNTAAGIREDDTIDVTQLAAGSTVDYTQGHILDDNGDLVSDSNYGEILDENGDVVLVIGNIEQMEVVVADGNDTVIVADADKMSQNDTTDIPNFDNGDVTDEVETEIAIDTFLTYDMHTNLDLLDTSVNPPVEDLEQSRLSVGQLRAIPGGTVDTNNRDDIPLVVNDSQFRFELGQDTDTVDYSNALDDIAAVINFNEDDNTNYVLVDGDSSAGFSSGDFTDKEDRIDQLVSVERIVASQYEAGRDAIIDLTNADRDVNVIFSYNQPENKIDFVEGVHKFSDIDRQVNTVRVSDAEDQAALGNVDLLEYRDLGNHNTAPNDLITQPLAVWTSVEGSDYSEYVQQTQWEDVVNHVFNLRGGQNEVNYNERTNGIELRLLSVDATHNGVDNQFQLQAYHLDTNGDANGNFDEIWGFAHDNIFNETTANLRDDTMRIEASQGDRDLINVYDMGESGIFLVGEVETSGSSVVTATFENGEGHGLVMSGFEYLWDGIYDDTYVVTDLQNFVSKLTLIDYNQYGNGGITPPSYDRDTIKLQNGAFETAAIRPPVAQSITVSNALHMGDLTANDLQLLGVNNNALRQPLVIDGLNDGDSEGFDFQVLDISEVTNQIGITAAGSALGTADELIVGGLNYLSATGTAITNFDILSLTGAGAAYDLDLDANELQTAANVKIVGFDADLGTLDLSRVTSASTVTVTDLAGVGAEVIGTAFNDTIKGSAGADTLEGGAGADKLDGGTAQEVRSVDVTGALAADGNLASINLFGLGNLVLSEVLASPNGIDQVIDGAGTSVVGQTMANLLNNNLTQLNADYQTIYATPDEVITGVSWTGGAAGGTMTFTFAAGVDVNNAHDIWATGVPDTGTIAFSAESVVAEGGSGGADLFVIGNTDSSIDVSAADIITGFTSGSDGLGLGLAGDATALTGNYVEAGLVVADYASALLAGNTALSLLADTSSAAELYAFEFDATNGYLFNDTDGNGSADQVIVLTGIDNTEIAATDIFA